MISPADLIAALEKVPADAMLLKNEVGNLAVVNKAGDWIGYVDLRSGEVDLWA